MGVVERRQCIGMVEKRWCMSVVEQRRWCLGMVGERKQDISVVGSRWGIVMATMWNDSQDTNQVINIVPLWVVPLNSSRRFPLWRHLPVVFKVHQEPIVQLLFLWCHAQPLVPPCLTHAATPMSPLCALLPSLMRLNTLSTPAFAP
jgi:hypothetical protein